MAHVPVLPSSILGAGGGEGRGGQGGRQEHCRDIGLGIGHWRANASHWNIDLRRTPTHQGMRRVRGLKRVQMLSKENIALSGPTGEVGTPAESTALHCGIGCRVIKDAGVYLFVKFISAKPIRTNRRQQLSMFMAKEPALVFQLNTASSPRQDRPGHPALRRHLPTERTKSKGAVWTQVTASGRRGMWRLSPPP